MGTGMTQKGAEIKELIDNLRPGVAERFMAKDAELDNVVADSAIAWKVDSSTGTIKYDNVQSWRRQMIEDAIDQNKPLDTLALSDVDKVYVDEYKAYKEEEKVAKAYNLLAYAWNNTDPKNVSERRMRLNDVQKFVNNLRITDKEMYTKMKDDLDRIPQMIKDWKMTDIVPKKKVDYNTSIGREDEIQNNLTKIMGEDQNLSKDRNAFNQKFWYENADEWKKKILDTRWQSVNPMDTNTGTPKIDTSIPGQKYNNVTPDGSSTTTTPVWTTGTAGMTDAQIAANNASPTEMKFQESQSLPSQWYKSSGGYSQKEYEPRVGYSSNSISRG